MSVGELPEPTRRTVYVGTNETVDPIRGRGFFEEQARLFPELVTVGDELPPSGDRCRLAVVLMPANGAIATELEDVADLTCRCRAVVDVFVDLWTPDPAAGDAYLAWWRADGRRDNLEAAIHAADLVTAPRVEILTALLERGLAAWDRVAVVPDCPDGEVTEAAAVGWAQALLLASGCRHRGVAGVTG